MKPILLVLTLTLGGRATPTTGEGEEDPYFVSGQPLSFAVKNALLPGTTAICL